MSKHGSSFQRRKQILFVCVENSCRSQMAEAFCRIHGGKFVDAHSAGSRPSGQVNRQAIESMGELGYDLTVHRSKSLFEVPDLEYDLVVAMGCGDECPLVQAKAREDWNMPDPKGLGPEEFRAVRNRIEARVKEMLK